MAWLEGPTAYTLILCADVYVGWMLQYRFTTKFPGGCALVFWESPVTKQITS